MAGSNKTKATTKSVAAFIAAVPGEGRRADAKAFLKLLQRVTGLKPRMWGPSIVGFGSYHYKYESGREGDMPLVGFSPRTGASVLYGLNGAPESKALLAELGKHKTDGGCIYVASLADLNQKTLERLVVKSMAATRARHPE